jgi:hypothetical protein
MCWSGVLDRVSLEALGSHRRWCSKVSDVVTFVPECTLLGASCGGAVGRQMWSSGGHAWKGGGSFVRIRKSKQGTQLDLEGDWSLRTTEQVIPLFGMDLLSTCCMPSIAGGERREAS